MSHNLHDKDTVVGSRGGMNTVDRIAGDIDGTLKSKGHIRSIDVIVNGLWKMDHIQPFLTQKIGCLLCTIAPQNDQTIQIEFIVSLFHCLDLIQTILIRNPHLFERLSG